MDTTDQTIDKISDALRLIREVDKVQEETDGDLMDTYADIPGMLRTYYNWRRAFEIHEFPYPNTVEEMEAILLKAFKPEEPKIHFYEVYFGEKTAYGNEDQPSICIRGIRKPTLEEANDWLKVECSFYGGPVTEIDEVDEETARFSYKMDNVVPVFGKDPPCPIHPHRTCYFVYRGSYLNPQSKMFRVWARNPEEALSAFKETWEANRDLLYRHHAFMAAVHGALEPYPLPRN